MQISQSNTAHSVSSAGDIGRALADVPISGCPESPPSSEKATVIGSGGRTVYVTAVILLDGEGFYACALGLKGLHVGGETVEAASRNARNSVELYLRCMRSNDGPLDLGEWISLEKRPASDQEQIVFSVSWSGRVLSGRT